MGDPQSADVFNPKPYTCRKETKAVALDCEGPEPPQLFLEAENYVNAFGQRTIPAMSKHKNNSGSDDNGRIFERLMQSGDINII